MTGHGPQAHTRAARGGRGVPSAPGGPPPRRPTPAGVGVSPARAQAPGWRRLALTLALALGLSGAGFALGSSWRAPTPPTPSTLTQPPLVPVTSILVRQVATPACLEAAERGDALIGLLVTNQRSRAAELLVPYHLASRQCAQDADP